jgi:predicted RNA binding protein YcfA (HicA-like mRNA interferase family)
MARFGSLKPREVVRALLKGGFYVHEQVGSHVQLKHPSKPGRVTVPNHQGFDLPKQPAQGRLGSRPLGTLKASAEPGSVVRVGFSNDRQEHHPPGRPDQ